jgi:dienelactone hydrolase
VIRLAIWALLLGVAAVGNASAKDDGPLTFDAKSIGTPNSGAPIELWRPVGAGPFPAMLVLHGCQGVGEGSRGWAARLVGWGYVAAIVDSFHPRKFNEVCDVGWLVPPELRAQDAFNAASYLRTRPDILPDRIGVIGFSHGGSSTMIAALSDKVPVDRGGRPFQAAVAYYPHCQMIYGQSRFGTDTLILIGQDDDWMPAEHCTNLVEASAGIPHVPKIKVYPGAVHGFDVTGLHRLSASGHLMRENREAAADSFVMTKAFLDERLKAR